MPKELLHWWRIEPRQLTKLVLLVLSSIGTVSCCSQGKGGAIAKTVSWRSTIVHESPFSKISEPQHLQEPTQTRSPAPALQGSSATPGSSLSRRIQANQTASTQSPPAVAASASPPLMALMPPPAAAGPALSGRGMAFIISIVVPVGIGLILFAAAALWARKIRRKNIKNWVRMVSDAERAESQRKWALGQLEALTGQMQNAAVRNGMAALDPSWVVDFQDMQFFRAIGEGSFGTVYLGRWHETTVAIKVLAQNKTGVQVELNPSHSAKSHAPGTGEQPSKDDVLLKELRQEAGLMASLRHPNVVLFLGVCFQPPAMVTEFCARGSLLDILQKGLSDAEVAAELDWPKRLNVALDAAKGMLYLHSRSPAVLHRDLKSANLLVDKHWRAKVADFNLSRVVQASAVESQATATNPRWLPPEALIGHPFDKPADVYAFGIILWELLTWQIPWETCGPWQVVIIVVEQKKRPEVPKEEDMPTPPPTCWTQYRDLMERCWASDPSDRPPFEVVINDLREMLEQESPATQTAEAEVETSMGSGVSSRASSLLPAGPARSLSKSLQRIDRSAFAALSLQSIQMQQRAPSLEPPAEGDELLSDPSISDAR